MIFTTPNKKASTIIGNNPDEMDMPRQGSDRWVLVAVIILMVFGSLAVYSAIAFFAESNGTTAFSLVTGHIMKLGIGFLILLITSKIDYHALAKLSHLAMIVSWGLLFAVMLFGSEVFGAQRALSIGSFSFQPSAFAVAALLVHVCVLLANKQSYIKDFKKAFLPIMFWVLITCALIGMEDFSRAALLLAMCLILMFIGRISILQLGGLVLIGLLGGSLILMGSQERQSRIDQYITQITDIKSEDFNVQEGYQAQQAYIAIARGEAFGVGIGKSTQRAFLPAPYNDFIFAIIAEEYGMLGSILVILLFSLILFRGFAIIAKNAPDTVGTLMAIACTLLITIYGLTNAGVASGLLPITGLPMPFVSYGGSNMVVCGLMIGILLNISKHSTKKRSVFYA